VTDVSALETAHNDHPDGVSVPICRLCHDHDEGNILYEVDCMICN
jgi:hypothetical protein